MLGFPLGILSAAGAGLGFESDYELIATEVLGSSQASVTFSNLGTHSSTYKHLQIRTVTNCTAAHRSRLQINGNTGTNYATHLLFANGSSVLSAAAANASVIALGTGIASANSFGANIIDFLDAYSTTKNTTVRAFSGWQEASEVALTSGVFINTSSMTSVTIFPDAGSYVAGSRFSLYGVKG